MPREIDNGNFLRGFEIIASLGYQLKSQGINNLDVLRETPDHPAVIYFNHSAIDDPVLVVSFLQRFVPERLDNVVIPVSHHHAQFKNYALYSVLTGLGRNQVGFQMPEVVQSYRRRGENPIDPRISRTLDDKFARLINSVMPSGPLIIIFPEGHRSEGASLMPAESGVGAVARVMKKLKDKGQIGGGFFMPLSIVFDNFKSGKIHYRPIRGGGVTIRIGEPITLESLLSESSQRGEGKEADKISHYLMERLTEILPESMHGFYHKSLLAHTYAGRFEKRSGEKGKFIVFDKLSEK